MHSPPGGSNHTLVRHPFSARSQLKAQIYTCDIWPLSSVVKECLTASKLCASCSSLLQVSSDGEDVCLSTHTHHQYAEDDEGEDVGVHFEEKPLAHRCQSDLLTSATECTYALSPPTLAIQELNRGLSSWPWCPPMAPFFLNAKRLSGVPH